MANQTVDHATDDSRAHMSGYSSTQMMPTIDQLTAKSGQLAAMLYLTYGETGASLAMASGDTRDSYMWACAQMAEDIHELARGIHIEPTRKGVDAPANNSPKQNGHQDFRGDYDAFAVSGSPTMAPALLVNGEAGPLAIFGAIHARMKFLHDGLTAWSTIGDIGEAQLDCIVGPLEAQAGEIRKLLDAMQDKMSAMGVKQ